VLLGKYRVDSIIGRGGMALVVKAQHMGLDEQVAIKLLRDDVAIADEMVKRFVREAQAAARLKGEHIARIIDVGTFDDGRPLMVMEYLEGQDLGQLIAERGWLQPSLAIDLVIQACEALAEAHALGIVHRDIKPTNLFLTSRPDGSVLLKVLDFGISKAPQGAELSLTQTWSLLGTPAYMSPEQMRSARNVDVRTDIWSLGAVLYEALEGHLPFQAESFSEMCVMVAVDPFTPTTETPRNVVPVISRCLAKSPDDRYPNVAELARDLARLAREPDKAQILVDRIYRMLGRTSKLRTPATGVPAIAQPALPFSAVLTAQPAPRAGTPTPIVYSDETPRTGYRSPFGDLPNGFTPATLAAGTPSGLDPARSVPLAAIAPHAAPSHALYAHASHGYGGAEHTPTPTPTPRPMTASIPGFAPPLPPPRPPEATPASGVPASASDAPAHAAGTHTVHAHPADARLARSRSPDPHAPDGHPAPPTHAADAHPSPRATPRATPRPTGRYSTYPQPLPQPLPGQLSYLRPGMELPRGGSDDLTTTQVISRPLRVWRVIIVTSVLAVLAALVTYHVMGGAPLSDDHAPPVVRMRATPGPIVSPIQEPAATPDPAAVPAGSNAKPIAPAPAPPADH
jgi:serine/threonine protein kinase